MHRVIYCLILALLAACTAQPEPEPRQGTMPPVCRQQPQACR